MNRLNIPVELSIREQIIRDIVANRRAWRFAEVPQLVILAILLIALGSVATLGLMSSIEAVRDPRNADHGIKILRTFVGGMSSLLGFAVLKLSVRFSELTKHYLSEEKRFTSDINRVRLSSTNGEIECLLKQYFKTTK